MYLIMYVGLSSQQMCLGLMIKHRQKDFCHIWVDLMDPPSFSVVVFFHQEIQATWYEKLHEWEDALVAYDKKIDMNKEDPELILGRMRCLEALGEWYVVTN